MNENIKALIKKIMADEDLDKAAGGYWGIFPTSTTSWRNDFSL